MGRRDCLPSSEASPGATLDASISIVCGLLSLRPKVVRCYAARTMSSALREMEALDVAPLFGALNRELIRLLRSLPVTAWNLPTVAGRWRVRDIAAHLLDGDMRKLAAHRDAHLHVPPGHAPQSYDGVVALINSLNATGVSYAERLSLRLLVDLLEITGNWVAEFIESLDPNAVALFPVAWAGETTSQNWMDMGREYTERWHHQMQIREATGAALLLGDDWYAPLLSFSIRALPRAYAAVSAGEGTCVNVEIVGRSWSWCLVRERETWHLYEGTVVAPAANVRISAEHAWRVFYNAIDSAHVESFVHIEGDRRLGRPLLAARSVMV